MTRPIAADGMIGVAAEPRSAAASDGMIGVAAEPDAFGAERRTEPRTRANAPARLFYGAGYAYWIDCAIKDRSRSGAKVQAPALFQLPPELMLLDFEQAMAFEAQVRWRKAELAGLWLHKSHDLRTTREPALVEVKKAWELLGPSLGYR